MFWRKKREIEKLRERVRRLERIAFPYLSAAAETDDDREKIDNITKTLKWWGESREEG